MSDNALIALIICTLFIGSASTIAFVKDKEHQVKIECYKAAQVNTNIKCEVKE